MAVLFAEQLLTVDGWVQSARLHLLDGRIAKLETSVAAQAGDERHAMIVPALSNLHSHAFQRGMAGLAEVRGSASDNFWSWRETMYRFALRMSPDQLEAVAAQAYVEMLEAGYCRVGEFHYLHHDVDARPYADIAEMAGRIVAAAAHTGIALTLLPVFYAHSSFGAQPPNERQCRFISDLDSYARLSDRCRQLVAKLPSGIVGVAPHSLRAVNPQELTEVARLLPEAPVHIHIAEQLGEVRDCIAWSGARPVRWLLDHAPVDARWCLVHATHVDADEVSGIAGSGAVVGLCPLTEANLGDGIFPVAEYLKAGGRFGVGTDSNVCISVSGELSLLEYSQRLSRKVRNVVKRGAQSTGAALFSYALDGGRRALADARFGIAEGADADLVSLTVSVPATIGRSGDAVLDSWIFASAGGVVDCLWVNGIKQVENGRHRQRERVQTAYKKAITELCA
ncbi:formimidoylglutamate deiminase [Solimonas marina]|uniref:Formimidoylglutamate deiminase n=1 Tax=Solimonas marina TaxID=2714601 RepID=A0A969W7V5_9GAMM|nr:formimidoylglutamate deiminase [Solimonas marina]NKF22316.1 formimidoylglutamate deiminase [Solimonas marina]